MDFLNRRTVSAQGLFDLSHLEPQVCAHLQRVYACLSMGLLAAAAGAYISAVVMPMYGIISCLASIGLLFYLHANRDDFSAKRHAAFAAFCGLAGAGLGPLLDMAAGIDPAIIVNAVIATLIVSVCFTAAVLLSKRSRMLLMMAGPLLSGLTALLVLSLVNIFLRSDMLLGLTLKLTLVIFSLFLMYDTQKVIEFARNGDKDYIAHCIDLFLDVIELFRTIIILMMRSKSQGERNERRKRKD